MTPFARLRAGFGLAVAQLRHFRIRTVLLVLAVALAVLSTTLLASVGVLETGTEMFDAADRDLWMSGGPTRVGPGGRENGIVDAHRVAAAGVASD